MNPLFERMTPAISKAFDRAKRGAFHVLVEVRVREEVGKSIKKGIGYWVSGIGSKTKETVITEGVDAVFSTPSQPEQTTTPSQQVVIPNNDSRASSEAIAKDEITNNDSSAPNTLQPYNPNTLPPTPDVELDPLVLRSSSASESEEGFPPITRKNFLKHPIFWARFLGYAIPLSFLLYVLYLNYLPFGYHKTFTINVGSPNDTKVSEFYLEPSKDLSDRMTAADGTTYRELNGMATAVFKPNAVLKDAEITVSVEGGEGISLIPPVIDFDPNSVEWDYNWDFSKGVPEGLINVDDRAFAYEGGTYFDGTARVEMASSSDMFEDGPFTVYAEWMPTDNSQDFQEIIGHYNWELFQNSDKIILQLGRMNNATGTFLSIKKQIDENFFNKKHTALISYMPLKNDGYIELYIDNLFTERLYFDDDTIFKDYGSDNFGLGWTSHNYKRYPHLKGTIYKLCIVEKNEMPKQKEIKFHIKSMQKISMLIKSNENTTFFKLHTHVNQK